MKQILFSLFISLLVSSSLIGQEDQLFSTANAAYKQADYKKAISTYLELVSSGKVSAELYYNLGNAYLKDEQVGSAILYYERALRLNPSDGNIQKNLELAREEVATPITEVPEFFILRIWKAFARIFSPLIWMIIQVLLALLLLCGIYLWRLVPDEKQKMKGFLIMLFSFLILLVAYFAGRSASYELSRKDAGIIMTNDSLRSGPDSRADEIEPLSSGVKVRVLDSIDEWYKVSLVNKEQGWIRKSAIELI